MRAELVGPTARRGGVMMLMLMLMLLGAVPAVGAIGGLVIFD
jgi:hypothetical protein